MRSKRQPNWRIKLESSNAIKEGEAAAAGSPCPYPEGHQPTAHRRSSWLAGHYDAHGMDAWEKSMSNSQNEDSA